MAQRAEAADSLDDFPTQPWAGRALIEYVIGKNAVTGKTLLEPACNRGYLAHALSPYFGAMTASDIFDYGWAGAGKVQDFLFPGAEQDDEADWIITNPPFRLASQFIKKALPMARRGVAMLVRLQFLEGQDRYKKLFSGVAPTKIAVFTERVPLFKGVVRDPAAKYWDPNGRDPETRKKTGCWKRPSTATSYCWVVWQHHARPEPLIWIPPCRVKLERAGDYTQPFPGLVE